MKTTFLTSDSWGEKIPRAEDGALGQLLLRIVDGGLIGVICIAPFFFGGRHDFGRLVLLSLIAATAAAWFLRQATLRKAAWPRTSAYAILLLAAGLLVFQTVPLPAAWIAELSPHTAKLLPLWTSGGSDAAQLGAWQTLSLIPHETTKSLAMLLSYGLLLVVVAGRIQSVDDVRRILGWVALAAVLMATFGVLQYFTSDGRYFWFYAHPHRSASTCLSGAFINRNHFAHFLILGIGPLMAWMIHILTPPRGVANRKPQVCSAQQIVAWVIAAAIVLVVLASLGSRSRGGAIALLVAVAVLVGIYFWRGLVDSRFLYGLVGLAAVVGAVLSWHGYDKVVERLDDLTAGSLEEIDRGGIRRKVWAANLASIESFQLTGAGAGSHREICPVYLPESFTREYTHAENGYLQVAAENGAAGLILLLACIGTVSFWCVKCFRGVQPAADIRWFGAAAAGLAASLVHSVVDFVWYIPACMSVTVVLAGCVLRLSQFAWEPGNATASVRMLPRGRWFELSAASILIGAWSVHIYVGPAIAAIHWDRYLRASVANSELADETMAQFVAGKGVAPHDARRALSQAMLSHLEAAVYWDPKFARAHRRLADRYVAEFELGVSGAANVLDVTQIRDAAMVSSFQSVAELQSWLVRAFGPNVSLLHRAHAHARRALELCPLQGDAYLRLAELAFLELGSPSTVEAYIDQGLLVRAHDRNVLTRAGRQGLAIGRLDLAVKHWSKCFKAPGRHQQEIVYRLVASGMPAKEFLASFHPNWQTLREIWAQYQRLTDPAELDEILTYAETETRRETFNPGSRPPASVWFWQSRLYADVGRSQESLACLHRAYACDPRQYFIRYGLARALQEHEQFAEAELHVRWCLARRPADKSLRAALETLSKARLQQRETEKPFDNRWKPRVTLATPAAQPSLLRN